MRISQVKVISTCDSDHLQNKINNFIKNIGDDTIVDIQYQSAFNRNVGMMQYSALIRYTVIV